MQRAFGDHVGVRDLFTSMSSIFEYTHLRSNSYTDEDGHIGWTYLHKLDGACHAMCQ
jgi:hypothetical protein